MKQSIGDFAENLIRGDMKTGSKQTSRANSVSNYNRPQRAGSNKGKDLSKIQISEDTVNKILENSFGVSDKDQESEDIITEDQLLTESTAKNLIESIESLKSLLVEITTAGGIGVNLAGPCETNPPKKKKRKLRSKSEIIEALRIEGYDI